MPRPEVYVSIDIETNGPIPGPYSMLSLGAAAFLEGDTTPVSTFEINLHPLPGAQEHPDTMVWWNKQDPEVWAHVTSNPQDPAHAMQALSEWVYALPGSPVLVVYPTWDALWVTWYTQYFLGRSPFGLGALDIKSMSFGLLSNSFKGTTKQSMPKDVMLGLPPHTHRALDDAIEQGIIFIRLLKKRQGLRTIKP